MGDLVLNFSKLQIKHYSGFWKAKLPALDTASKIQCGSLHSCAGISENLIGYVTYIMMCILKISIASLRTSGTSNVCSGRSLALSAGSIWCRGFVVCPELMAGLEQSQSCACPLLSWPQDHTPTPTHKAAQHGSENGFSAQALVKSPLCSQSHSLELLQSCCLLSDLQCPLEFLASLYTR